MKRDSLVQGKGDTSRLSIRGVANLSRSRSDGRDISERHDG
jgi:hypothetical protein